MPDHRQRHATAFDVIGRECHHELVVLAACRRQDAWREPERTRDWWRVVVHRQRVEVDVELHAAATSESAQVGGDAVGDIHHRVDKWCECLTFNEPRMRAAMALDRFDRAR